MGNFSSCTSGFTSDSPASLPNSPVARVLLVDGSVLKFKVPIKVIKLLLDYPHHFICPLDSLRPGLHSLSSLLPDEELQLGNLYLLLPFKTFENRRNMPMVGGPNEGFSRAKACGEQKGLLVRHKSDVGYSSCDHYCNNYHVGYSRSHDYGIDNKRRSKAGLSKESESSHNSLANCSRLCNTPELQKAYQSVMLRRSKSWTPRLQSIKENKRVCADSIS